MKKLIMMALLVAFTAACATPALNEDTEAYGTDKSKAVNTEGSSSELEADNSED